MTNQEANRLIQAYFPVGKRILIEIEFTGESPEAARSLVAASVSGEPCEIFPNVHVRRVYSGSVDAQELNDQVRRNLLQTIKEAVLSISLDSINTH